MVRKPSGRPAGRPATVGRKTTLGLRDDLLGWIDFRALDTPMSDYLNGLAAADRARVLTEGGEDAERYRAYLIAAGRTKELEGLDSA